MSGIDFEYIKGDCMMIDDYEVVFAGCPVELQEQVVARLGNGWTVIGGASVTCGAHGMMSYVQALVKPAPLLVTKNKTAELPGDFPVDCDSSMGE